MSEQETTFQGYRRWDHQCSGNDGLIVIMLDAQYWCDMCGVWCPWKKPPVWTMWHPSGLHWQHYCYNEKTYRLLESHVDQCNHSDCGVIRPVGVHDLGEGLRSTENRTGSTGLTEGASGEVRDGEVGTEKSLAEFARDNPATIVEFSYTFSDDVQRELDIAKYGEDDFNYNQITFFVERFKELPTQIECAVDTGKLHGPDENTPANRLIWRWESDPDVPGYVLDEFKQFVKYHEIREG